MPSEEKTIDLTTNPKQIVLVDTDHTKKRLEELEKKSQRWGKIEKVSGVSTIVSMSSGLALFLEEGIRETIEFGVQHTSVTIMGAAGFAAAGVLGCAGLAAHTIAEKRKNKIDEKLEAVRKTIASREKAKSDPNLVIEEKSEKQKQLERKLKKLNPEKIEKVGAVVAASVGGIGVVGGYVIGDFLGAVGCGGAAGLLSSLPFVVLWKIAEKRKNKLKGRLDETIKTEHPDFYRQELLAEMSKISEAAKEEVQTQEQKLSQVDLACKRAKECDSVDTIERLLAFAKNPSNNKKVKDLKKLDLDNVK